MDKDENKRLNRRDMLRALTLAPSAALVTLAPGLAAPAAARPASPQGAQPSEYTPKVFDPREWQTLQRLSDLIIPADEQTGSATQAGVPEFIDDRLHLRGGLLRTQALGWLTWLSVECNRLYNHEFVDCSEAQQKQILDRVAYPATAAPEDANAVAGFNHIRDLVLSGFYSSAMGVKDLQYLGNKVVENWEGCPENVTSRLGVDYSDWEYWSKGAGEDPRTGN